MHYKKNIKPHLNENKNDNLKYDKNINAYFDESRIDNPESNHMVCGGIFVERKYAKQIRKDLQTILKNHSFNGEIKWSKTDKNRLAMYKAIVDYFFTLPAYKASFNCIVIDKTQVDLKKYHNDDKELAFFKFIYILLKKRVQQNTKYYFNFDFKPTKIISPLAEVGSYLDLHMREHTKTSVIQHIQSYPSHESILIQLADLFSGAVAFAFNEDLSLIRPKQELEKYIATKIGKEDLIFRSSPQEKKFNIFAIDLNVRR